MQKASILKRFSALAIALAVSFAAILPAYADEIPQFFTVDIEHPDPGPAAGVPASLPEADVTAAADSLPSSYDGRTKGYLTSIKNQTAANCCWAFSCVGAIEANYCMQGFGSASATDFSEAHLTWFGQRQRVSNQLDPTYGDGIFYDDPFSYGGNWQIMASSVFRGSGMQLESNAPWIGSDTPSELKPKMTQSENDRYVSYARLWSAEGILEPAWRDAWLQIGKSMTEVNSLWNQAKADAIPKAKRCIMENGAVTLSYFHTKTQNSDPYFNSTYNAYYQNATTDKTNHSVTIVGWDDNFSRTRFNASCRPASNGAWLVRGSWSTRYGDNGYYWLSYFDPSIRCIASFSTAKADIYSHIYQYDGCYPGTFSPIKSGSAMANVFLSGGDEILSHVVFYSPNVTPVNALIEVYVSDDAFPQINPLKHDPTEYMQRVDAASTTVQNVPYGYITVPLISEVSLYEGQPFVVKVTFTRSDGSTVWIPIEGLDSASNDVRYGGNPSESFLKAEGGKWYDTTNFVNKNLHNVPIKAMTRDADAATPHLELLSAPDRTQYRIGETLDSKGLSLAYLDARGTQTVITDGYTLTLSKFTQPGDFEIPVTYAGLSCTFSVHVDRTPGDSNGDGQLDLKDVTLMRRVLAGWTVEGVYEANLDVSGDGKLSLLDVAILTRYLAGGYDVELK